MAGTIRSVDLSRARTKDPDDWLESAPAFSRPLATQVREWVQRWEPDLAESIKWNCLCYSGQRLVFGLSACKKHLGLVFFRGQELPDPRGLFASGGEANTSVLTLRITTLEDSQPVADGSKRDAATRTGSARPAGR